MTGEKFKVDFFCVGVAKAGTTTLHDLLSLQSTIALPKRKETNYFSFGMLGKPSFSGPLDNTSVNEPTITSFDEYVSDFEHSAESVIGEICPSYVLSGAAQNIHDHNPDAKIIILLREPVSRSYSNYQHLVRDGREYSSFEDALDAEADRLEQGWEWFWGLKSNSQYSRFVNDYIELFGKENIKVMFFEEFVKDQFAHVQEVMEFVGLDPTAAVHEELNSNQSGVVSGKWKLIHKAVLSEGPINSILRVLLPQRLRKKLGLLFKSLSTVKGGVSPETKLVLSREFATDLNRLNTLVGGKVGHWLESKHVS